MRNKLSERVEGQVKPLTPTSLGGESGLSASICYLCQGVFVETYG